MEKASTGEASAEMTVHAVETWRRTAFWAAGEMQTLLVMVTESGPREKVLTKLGTHSKSTH